MAATIVYTDADGKPIFNGRAEHVRITEDSGQTAWGRIDPVEIKDGVKVDKKAKTTKD